MNRRHLLLSGLSLIAYPIRSLAFDDRPQPVDFISRTFLGSNTDALDAVRFLKSSAFQFSSAADALAAITWLSGIRMEPSMDELSILDVKPIEPEPDFDAEDFWFVSYTTVAGVAAFESHHAHAIFAIEKTTCEIVVSTNGPTLAETELRRLSLLISDRAMSLQSQRPESLVLEETDVPLDMIFGGETTPASTTDRQGTTVPEDVPEWELI